MRILSIILVVVMVVGIGALAIHYNKNAFKAQQELVQERYKRMLAEENVEKFTTKINSLEGELVRAQNRVKGSEKLLEQTKAVNDDLKSRLDKVSQIKATLEDKIKELEQVSSNVSKSPSGS